MSHLPWRRPRTSVTARDPFSQMQAAVDQMFEGVWGPQTSTGNLEPSMNFSPAVDLHETDKGLELTAELPGLKEDDVNLSIDNDMLTLSGEKKFETRQNKDGVRYYETSYGSFQRRVTLPFEVDREKVQATFKNGVLKVTMDRVNSPKNAIRKIPIRST